MAADQPDRYLLAAISWNDAVSLTRHVPVIRPCRVHAGTTVLAGRGPMLCRGPSVTAEQNIRPCLAGSGGRIVKAYVDEIDGGHVGQEAMLEKARESMEAGATGLIFGRNVFQRGHDESLRFVAQLKEILAKYPS
jgi:hypothetical protein